MKTTQPILVLCFLIINLLFSTTYAQDNTSSLGCGTNNDCGQFAGNMGILAVAVGTPTLFAVFFDYPLEEKLSSINLKLGEKFYKDMEFSTYNRVKYSSYLISLNSDLQIYDNKTPASGRLQAGLASEVALNNELNIYPEFGFAFQGYESNNSTYLGPQISNRLFYYINEKTKLHFDLNLILVKENIFRTAVGLKYNIKNYASINPSIGYEENKYLQKNMVFISMRIFFK